jgi:hypothetical protein
VLGRCAAQRAASLQAGGPRGGWVVWTEGATVEKSGGQPACRLLAAQAGAGGAIGGGRREGKRVPSKGAAACGPPGKEAGPGGPCRAAHPRRR